MTAITELTDEDFKNSLREVVKKYMVNPPLVLR